MEKHVVIIYLALISVVAIIVTCRDKYASKRPAMRRTPEKTLLIISALGGSPAMYLTMRVIHHKTRHKKFMIGIPVIFVLQIAAVIAVLVMTLNK